MKLTLNKRVIGLLAVVLAAELLLTGGVILLQRSRLQAMDQQLAAKRAEETESERLASRLTQTEGSLRSDEERLAWLESGVSDADYVPTLLRDLERLAQATQSRLIAVRPEPKEVKPASTSATARSARQKDIDKALGEGRAGGDKGAKPTEPEAPYEALYIRVSMIGGYTQTQSFLQRLNRFPKIIGVEEVQIRPYQQPTGGLAVRQLQVELRLKAYIMKESPAPAPPAGASATGAVS